MQYTFEMKMSFCTMGGLGNNTSSKTVKLIGMAGAAVHCYAKKLLTIIYSNCSCLSFTNV